MILNPVIMRFLFTKFPSQATETRWWDMKG